MCIMLSSHFFCAQALLHGRLVWGFFCGQDAVQPAYHLEQASFAAQDNVAVRLRLRGTHSGEFLGICSDMTNLLRQLG
jgi:hypothetical protein